MKKILLTASAAGGPASVLEQYPARLPESWSEVPIGPYALLLSAKKTTERIQAMAELCGIEARLMLEDTGLFGKLFRELTWLQSYPLPEELPQKQLQLEHLGRVYSFVGGLHKMNAGQLEAVLDFIQAHEAAPLRSAPALLAVLYVEQGREQDEDAVEQAAEAFHTLPVSVAWPALLSFLRSGASAALHIRTASAQVRQVEELLRVLEEATRGASIGYSVRLRRWLVRTWIRSARSLLSRS